MMSFSFPRCAPPRSAMLMLWYGVAIQEPDKSGTGDGFRFAGGPSGRKFGSARSAAGGSGARGNTGVAGAWALLGSAGQMKVTPTSAQITSSSRRITLLSGFGPRGPRGAVVYTFLWE